MEEVLKLTLNGERVFLQNNLQLDPSFWAHIIESGILTDDGVNSIQDNKRTEHISKLVDLLKKRPSADYYTFLRILRDTGQKHIAGRLQDHEKRLREPNNEEEWKFRNFVRSRNLQIDAESLNVLAKSVVLRASFEDLSYHNKVWSEAICSKNPESQNLRRCLSSRDIPSLSTSIVTEMLHNPQFAVVVRSIVQEIPQAINSCTLSSECMEVTIGNGRSLTEPLLPQEEAAMPAIASMPTKMPKIKKSLFTKAKNKLLKKGIMRPP